MDFQNKVVVITGGSDGIGKALVQLFLSKAAKVATCGRNADRLYSLQQEFAGRALHAVVADVSKEDDCNRFIETTVKAFGGIDILINNAGRSRPLDVVGAEDEWTAAMTLDFDRHRQLTQQLLPQFMEHRQGTILNIISTYELRSINASAVAKASIAAWSKQLASQLGPHGIRVNCLQPGLIDTANIRPFFPGDERRKFAEREIPLGDFGEPQDIANMATFLVSPRAGYITGSVAVVDGGMRHYAF